MPSLATWRKVQAISGLFFGSFLALHLITHVSNIVSQDVGDSTMRSFRAIYQLPVYEMLLTVSLLLHMTSNTVIYLQRGKKSRQNAALSIQKKTDGDTATASDKKASSSPSGAKELSLHRYAGYILGVFIFGHVFAVRFAPYMSLGAVESEMYGYTMVYLASVDFGKGFVVYLMIFGLAGFWHFTYGTYSALAFLTGSSVQGKQFPEALTVLTLFSSILLINSVLAITGYHHYDVVVAEEKLQAHHKINAYMGI